MALMNHVVRNFEGVGGTPGAVFADGDCTLFLPGTAQLYEDSQTFLGTMQAPDALVLVSANPDPAIAHDRLQVLTEVSTAASVSEVHAPKLLWDKAPLYREAAQIAPAHIETGIVVDDRWFAGIVRAIHGIRRGNPSLQELQTYCMRRPESRGDIVSDPIIRAFESRAFRLVAGWSFVRRRIVDNHPDYPAGVFEGPVTIAEEAA